MQFTPSNYQLDIFKFIEEGQGNAVINAVAGSGKTTTLVEAMKLINNKYSTLFLAFNKSIREELERRVENSKLSVDVSTCHSHGFNTIINNIGKRPKIDNLKYNKLLHGLFDYNISGNKKHFMDFIVDIDDKLVNSFNVDWSDINDRLRFRRNILQLSSLSRMLLIDNYDDLERISHKYDIEITDNEHIYALDLVHIGRKTINYIDFTDMVYLPVYYKMDIDKYDMVFIDECQDLNSAQRELMLMTLGENSRFIAVGDKNQAIYAFAGADSESFNKLTRIPNTITLPLSECYRCGSDILETIKDIVPDIIPHSSTGTGKFDDDAKIKDVKDGDLVLCRNVYPIVKLCLEYIKNNKKAYIIGSDIAQSLIQMITDTKKTNVIDVFSVLYDKLDTLCEKIMKTKGLSSFEAMKTNEYCSMEEKIETLEAISLNITTANKLIKLIEKIFNNTGEGIILSTIHKAKGLENARVFIIHPELLPSKHAKKPWQIEQEKNLKYVAYTRAKQLLGIVRDYNARHGSGNESFREAVLTTDKPKFVGTIGKKYHIVGTISDMKYLQNYNSMVYTIKDKQGNIFEKWGKIDKKFITSKNSLLGVGSNIDMYGVITKHQKYNDTNKNVVGRLSSF
jgi:superfamily I DNA/RNA helicase